MKHTLLFIAFLAFFISCKEEKKVSTPLEKLQENRQVLQHQIDSLNQKLKEVETAISVLDTAKHLQKVTVFSIEKSLFQHYISLQGIVTSDQNVMLRPEMAGTVQRILVKEGQWVQKGQTLLQLDASTLHDKVAEVETQLHLAKTTYERQERLWKQKIGSEMQYLNAKTQKETLERSLDLLHNQIGKMKIKAPFSGVVDAVHSKIGELAMPQSTVLRLINLNKVHVEADVPETYLPNIKRGTPVWLYFVALDKRVQAKINEVGNYINPNNRSFKVKINLKNKDHSLKPNLLADININDFSAEGIVIPSYLIQMNQRGEKFVYIIQRDSVKNKVVKKNLELGKEYNSKVLILNGLTEKDQVIDEGGKFVKEGDEVLVK